MQKSVFRKNSLQANEAEAPGDGQYDFIEFVLGSLRAMRLILNIYLTAVDISKLPSSSTCRRLVDDVVLRLIHSQRL